MLVLQHRDARRINHPKVFTSQVKSIIYEYVEKDEIRLCIEYDLGDLKGRVWDGKLK